MDLVALPETPPPLPTGGVSFADTLLGMARLQALIGPCAHADPVEVRTVTDALVAWLCPACDASLPAEWKDSDDA